MRRGVLSHAAGALAVALVVAACASEPLAPPPTPAPTSAPSPSPASPSASPSPSSTTASPSRSPSPSTATTTVEVFFSNIDRGDPCEDVFGVPRDVPADEPLRGALTALLAGPTAEEAEAGYGGWFDDATADLLLDVRVEQRVALVDLDPRLPEVIPNASSSCGSTALLGSLDATATQFTAIDEARYGLDGDRVAFYHWLQRPAPGDQPPPDLPDQPPPDLPDEPSEEPSGPVPSSPGPRAVPPDLVGTEWTTLPTTERVVALTFDGGANADGAASILRTLAETGTPATFFLTGRFTDVYPAFSSSIGGRHPVGNHTMHHRDLTDLTDDQVREEVLRAHDAIQSVAGRDPRPWFRFPYGARDDRTIDLVNELGYGAVRWTTDTLGWQGTSRGRTVETVVGRVLDDLQPGQVVLLHLGSHPDDGSTLDADALPEIVRRVRAAGYTFVDLDARHG